MQEIRNQIQKLENQLTGNLFNDMKIRDQIHNLKMKRNLQILKLIVLVVDLKTKYIKIIVIYVWL